MYRSHSSCPSYCRSHALPLPHSLCPPFLFLLIHRLPWIQCRLHISLYIPRVCLCVLCYPLTLLHMQFLWSDTSISVTKYTHAHAQTTKWRAVVVVVAVAADFCIFKCADLPKKRMKKRILHTKAYNFFFVQAIVYFYFQHCFTSKHNINESVWTCMSILMCVRVCLHSNHIRCTTHFVRVNFFFCIQFGFILYNFFLLLPNNTQIRTQLHIK